MHEQSLLRLNDTCSAIEVVTRAAVLIDNQAYFSAAAAAIRGARHSVWVLGWEFDPRTALKPQNPEDAQEQIGALLKRVAEERPELEVRVLIWDAALPLAAGKRLMPQRASVWFEGSRVEFKLDSTVPEGATHHQKLLVVDDALAFCSGTDFSPNRWDRPEHLDRDGDRVTVSGKIHPPRHATTLMVSGPAAKALGDLARDRWQRCTGTEVAAAPEAAAQAAAEALWPADLPPDFERVPVGVSRTLPAYGKFGEVRENEALYLAGIRAARHRLYFENQYFSSSILGEALAARLDEPDGPEIVVINGEHAPSTFDHATMDPARDKLVRKLRAADRFGRFQIYAPHSPQGATILMHSKLMIVDDRFIRIGSSNIADRSLGYDSECDLAIELDRGAPERRAISNILHRLIAHFVGARVEQTAEAIRSANSLVRAIDTLDESQPRRLRALSPAPLGFPRSVVAKYKLGDPQSTADAWRPWRRGGA